MNEIVKPHWDEKQLNIIRSTICKNCSDEEISLFSYICQRTQLDPFARQIYAVKRGNNMTIQTGIDGFRLIAERTNRYAPGKEPTYEYDKNGKILKATAYIKKQTNDGTWHEVSASAYWSEYAQEYNGKPSQFWGKLPHLMLGKCAESLALRKAFPADLSGLYTDDEMSQADVKPVDIDVKPIDIDVKPEEKEPVKPETASKENVDTLLSLIEKCPQEFKDNFKKLTEKQFGDSYKISVSYCEKCTLRALQLIKESTDETP